MNKVRHFILNLILVLFIFSFNGTILKSQDYYTPPDVYKRLENEIVKHREASRQYYTFINTMTYIGIIVLVGSIYAVSQWLSTKKYNRILAEQITEAMKYKKKYQELKIFPVEKPSVENPAELSDKELFTYLRDLIESERLFLNADFDRQTLIQRTGLSKERIGAAFSQGSDQERITTLVRELRLEYAVRLMNDRPELNVEQVCIASGFTNPDTFARNFKSKYGMTPSSYMKSKK